MEELDERTFLFGIQVRPNGGGLGGIAYHKFHRLGFDGGLESWGGVRNLLLRHRNLRGIDLSLDLLEFFVVEETSAKAASPISQSLSLVKLLDTIMTPFGLGILSLL